MKNISVNKINLQHMKKTVERIHPGKSYRITEYETYYVIGITEKGSVIQPMIFNKKGAFPILKSIAEMPKETGKVIYESGGKKNGKK